MTYRVTFTEHDGTPGTAIVRPSQFLGTALAVLRRCGATNIRWEKVS
jgi:hypothetical protein